MIDICKITFYTKPSKEFLEFVQDFFLDEQQTDEHYTDELMNGFCFLNITNNFVAP